MIGYKKDKNIHGIGNKSNHSLHNLGHKFSLNASSVVPHIVSPNANIIDAHNSNSKEVQKMPIGINKHLNNKVAKSNLEKR